MFFLSLKLTTMAIETNSPIVEGFSQGSTTALWKTAIVYLVEPASQHTKYQEYSMCCTPRLFLVLKF